MVGRRQGEALASKGNNVMGEECWEYGPNSVPVRLHYDEERLSTQCSPISETAMFFLESSHASRICTSAKTHLDQAHLRARIQRYPRRHME
jgi:hypothetical protein